jgi:AcrR family transcriptional regulator
MKINELKSKPLRSQPTRDRILQAARVVFGRDGYEKATIRAIAAEADINHTMVIRYYQNKEALFAAATEFKIDMNAYANVPKSKVGEMIVRRILEMWESPDSGPGRRAMLLTALSNESAREKFLEQARNQYVQLLTQFGTVRQGGGVAALIGTQVLGLIVSRYILRSPEVVTLSNEFLIREVGRTLQSYMRELK